MDEQEQQAENERQAQIRRDLLAPPQRETVMSAGRSGGAFAERPARSYVTGRWTQRFRIAAVALTAGAVLLTLVRLPFLPETIPVHFNGLGEPDEWGSKYSILMLALVASVMTGGMAWLSHHPRIYNYLREITEENAQRQYRVGEQLMVAVTVSVSLIFSGILITTATSVNVIFFVIPGIVIMLGALVWGISRLSRA